MGPHYYLRRYRETSTEELLGQGRNSLSHQLYRHEDDQLKVRVDLLSYRHFLTH